MQIIFLLRKNIRKTSKILKYRLIFRHYSFEIIEYISGRRKFSSGNSQH